jgi:uncharacterized protein YyaL (SSP411 family)
LERALQAMKFTHGQFISEQYSRPRFLEDYALLIQASLDLYEATADAKHLQVAEELQKKQDETLWDAVNSGYWDGPPRDGLCYRTKSVDESHEFAPNAVACLNLTRLWRSTGNKIYEQKALGVLQAFAGAAAATSEQLPAETLKRMGNTAPMLRTPEGPSLHARLLTAYQRFVDPTMTFLVTGPADGELARLLRRTYRPGSNIVFIDSPADKAAWKERVVDLQNNLSDTEPPAVLFCQDFKFKQKITDSTTLSNLLKELY